MRWIKERAEAVLQLRCIDTNGDWEAFVNFALVHDALGNHALAADFWTKAVDFIEDPIRRAGYDEELIDDYRQHRDAARERARLAAEAQPAPPSAEPERAP